MTSRVGFASDIAHANYSLETSKSMPTRLMPSVFPVTIILIFLVVLIFAAGYWFGRQNWSSVITGNETIFQRAIDDAKSADSKNISDQLWAINVENPNVVWQKTKGESRIKVTAWMDNKSFEKFYKPYIGDPDGSYTPPPDIASVWVTLAPQVKVFCQRLMATADGNVRYDPAFRLKQYMGLNPNYRYERFVEMWVNVDDVFRVCPDPEINDHTCRLSFDDNNPPSVKAVKDYPAFFEKLVATQYQPGPFAAPWTRLGYTYDWARGVRNVGASEFMLVPNAHYLVDAAYTTLEYCAAQ